MFKTFYFDGNDAWGMVDSIDEWKRIVDAHKSYTVTVEILMEKSQANHGTNDVEAENKEANDEYVPNFGFRIEHQFKPTLADWAKANGMYDLLVGVK